MQTNATKTIDAAIGEISELVGVLLERHKDSLDEMLWDGDGVSVSLSVVMVGESGRITGQVKMSYAHRTKDAAEFAVDNPKQEKLPYAK